MACLTPHSFPGAFQGTRQGTEWQAELPCTLTGLLFFLFSFFAEHVVLNLSKLNMQFPQQINSWLKMLSVKKSSLSLCNTLCKCVYNSKNTPSLKSTSSCKRQPASTGKGLCEHQSTHRALLLDVATYSQICFPHWIVNSKGRIIFLSRTEQKLLLNGQMEGRMDDLGVAMPKDSGLVEET